MFNTSTMFLPTCLNQQHIIGKPQSGLVVPTHVQEVSKAACRHGSPREILEDVGDGKVMEKEDEDMRQQSSDCFV